jgi:hypothetical protein
MEELSSVRFQLRADLICRVLPPSKSGFRAADSRVSASETAVPLLCARESGHARTRDSRLTPLISNSRLGGPGFASSFTFTPLQYYYIPSLIPYECIHKDRPVDVGINEVDIAVLLTMDMLPTT